MLRIFHLDASGISANETLEFLMADCQQRGPNERLCLLIFGAGPEWKGPLTATRWRDVADIVLCFTPQLAAKQDLNLLSFAVARLTEEWECKVESLSTGESEYFARTELAGLGGQYYIAVDEIRSLTRKSQFERALTATSTIERANAPGMPPILGPAFLRTLERCTSALAVDEREFAMVDEDASLPGMMNDILERGRFRKLIRSIQYVGERDAFFRNTAQERASCFRYIDDLAASSLQRPTKIGLGLLWWAAFFLSRSVANRNRGSTAASVALGARAIECSALSLALFRNILTLGQDRYTFRNGQTVLGTGPVLEALANAGELDESQSAPEIWRAISRRNRSIFGHGHRFGRTEGADATYMAAQGFSTLAATKQGKTEEFREWRRRLNSSFSKQIDEKFFWKSTIDEAAAAALWSS